MARQKEEGAEFSSKEMLTSNADAKTKIRYTDRLKVEILHDTQFYKAGQIINPHKVKGEALVKQGIAKKVPKED